MGLSWLRQHDLVLVFVLVIMVTSSAIELTGDNVCHRMENYTISLKESYMEPVVVNTFIWCFQIPPRCPNSRVEMRERWRIKTEIRQKKVAECCEGYSVERNTEKSAAMEKPDVWKCQPQCGMCENGNCVAPNTCECKPGYRGDGCNYECPSGSWGKNCTETCNCQAIEICSPVDGTCHCPSGWQGPNCKEKCPPGLWGTDCELSCACDNEKFGNNERLPTRNYELPSICHHETGSCIDPREITASVFKIIANNRTDREENIGSAWSNSTAAVFSSSSTESLTTERIQTLNTDHDISYANVDLVDKSDADDVRAAGESGDSATRLQDHGQPAGPSASDGRSSNKMPSDAMVPEIKKTGTSSITTSIGTNKYDNYNVQQRVERINMKVPKIKKPSTSGPIVAVVHVSGNGSPDHEGPMIMTSLGAENIPSHTVPMPLDIAALVVIGSIISLGLTTLAVLAILHIRSKLFETIRLSICDAEKRDINNDTIRRAGLEKSSSGRISSTASNNPILACEYETPRCIVPEHRTLTRSRPASSAELTKKQESNYSNDYPNIRLFNNLQELLEAHYDRPPSTFRPTVLEVDDEHVYDEIPLQSSTTFATMKRDL